jgi:hypothetical protein
MRLGLPLSDAPLPHLEDAERQFGMDLGSGSFKASGDPGAEPGSSTGVTHPVRR